jgi:hypothetical protein
LHGFFQVLQFLLLLSFKPKGLQLHWHLSNASGVHLLLGILGFFVRVENDLRISSLQTDRTNKLFLDFSLDIAWGLLLLGVAAHGPTSSHGCVFRRVRGLEVLGLTVFLQVLLDDLLDRVVIWVLSWL